MASELYKKKNFLLDLPYLISIPIYEYDISKANINILYHEKAISIEEYSRLRMMSRQSRQVSIGLMIKENPKINEVLANGIIEAKRKFFEANNIQDNEILSIKNDAVFVTGRQMQHTKFENIEFLLKNYYSLYMKIFNLEIYYRSDQVTGWDMIDVKGINDSKLELHRNGMLVLLSEVFEQLDCGNLEDALSIFTEYYNAYIQRQLPIEFYRTFDSNSSYMVTIMGQSYSVTHADINILDISYNMNFLRQIYGYISYLYFSTRK